MLWTYPRQLVKTLDGQVYLRFFFSTGPNVRLPFLVGDDGVGIGVMSQSLKNYIFGLYLPRPRHNQPCRLEDLESSSTGEKILQALLSK